MKKTVQAESIPVKPDEQKSAQEKSAQEKPAQEKPAQQKKFRAKVQVNRDLCKRCGICVAFCPHKVLGTTMSGYPVAERLDKCTGCKLCYQRCPDFAVEVRKEEIK